MSIIYEDVLERLKEERHNKQWSQAEMGRIVRMSQSHYSKVEQGKKRFSYYETQYLCESDIDSYYIFTGKRCEGKSRDFLEECSYEELVCILNIICSVIEYFGINSSYRCMRELYEKVKYVKSITSLGKREGNIFLNLRKVLGYSQKKMAESVGTDVKKFRELERGKVLPDSEIIWRMYHLYNVPPALVVKSKSDVMDTMVELLEMMGVQYSTILFDYLKQIHLLLS